MIRRAVTEDAKALFRLEEQIFNADNYPLSLRSFYYHIKHNPIFVYQITDQIVGYCLWFTRPSHFRLYSIGVLPDYRGQGIADQLLAYAFSELPNKAFRLEVRVDNPKAIQLYQKHGFRITKTLKDYYPNSIDGYQMVKTV